MATYEKGDSDEEVARFQRKLGIRADGEYGSETVAAVKAWQKANGQKVDGMVGPDMLLALGVVELIILENGDDGELVRRVQELVGVEADGDYGDETVKAVRAFQRANKLKASGSADLKTLGAMGVLDGTQPSRSPGPRQLPQQKSARSSSSPAASRGKQLPPPKAPIAERSAPSEPDQPSAQQAGDGKRGVRSWAYQLADIDPKKIAALSVDLVVIDYAADGDDATAFKAADVKRMKQRSGGGEKLVVSYMSIGEAEDYRYYWQAGWKNDATRPAWLDALNPDWDGNYKVRYWDADWQAVILGSPEAYLDRIIAAGFDGVYLDIIDAFEYWRDEKRERPDADKDMIAFVTRIAKYARVKRPGFLIIPQNGEALLDDPAYCAVISMQAKEDIFYGADSDGRANSKGAISECLEHLAQGRAHGVPVIAIEYLKDGKKISDASARLAEAGCVAYFADRDLDELNLKQFKV